MIKIKNGFYSFNSFVKQQEKEKDIQKTIIAPKLKGKDVHEAWSNCLSLSAKERYKMLSNSELLKPIFESKSKDIFETASLHKYLNIRYF